MRLEEEKTQKELKSIETKTQNIIQIIDEQAVKMAKLYSDEAEVKQAIKIVLKEEQDVIMQIAQLTASMEIQSPPLFRTMWCAASQPRKASPASAQSRPPK